MDKKIAIRQAKAAAAQNNFPGAQTILKNVLREDPNSVEAWVVLARVVDNETYARECLDRALFFDPGNTEALKHLKELDDPLTDLYSFTEAEEEQEFDIDLELPNAYEITGVGMPGIEPKISEDPAPVETAITPQPTKSKPRPKKKVQKKKSLSPFEIGLVIVVVFLIIAVIAIVIAQNFNLLPF